MRTRPYLPIVVCVATLFYAACTSAPNDARIGVRTPDSGQFPVVADLLGRRCGSLDCHGALPRNLRVYGKYGLRADAKDVPGDAPTTPTEYNATFRSVVGLEPALMTAVVEKQAEPGLLTLVRKSRGTEDHKGGAVFVLGDAADLCLTSWLHTMEGDGGNGTLNVDMCKKANDAARMQ